MPSLAYIIDHLNLHHYHVRVAHDRNYNLSPSSLSPSSSSSSSKSSSSIIIYHHQSSSITINHHHHHDHHHHHHHDHHLPYHRHSPVIRMIIDLYHFIIPFPSIIKHQTSNISDSLCVVSCFCIFYNTIHPSDQS